MATETSAMAVIRASRPSFRNAHDKIVFALHSSFLAAGYVLVATGSRAYAEEALSASASGEAEVGIDGWNEFEDCYAFVYCKAEKGSKRTVLVKCLKIEDKLAIDVLCCEEEKEPLHLEINVNDYVSVDVGGSTNYGSVYKNFGLLVECFNSSILAKLDEKSRNSTTSRLSGTHSKEVASGTQTGERTNNSRNPPRGPFVSETGITYPPVIPTGTTDLYPGPGAGFYPTRGGMGAGGNMLIGPDDPRWYRFGSEQPEFIPGISDGALPPGVPPGARFDPYGPPGIPGFEPNRFVRNSQRRSGSDIHPDLEHFKGPGFPDYI